MAYRAQPRRIRPTRETNGRLTPNVRRHALARTRAHPRPPGGPGLGSIAFVIFVVGLVTVLATSTFAVGGTAVAVIQGCEEGLPDVRRFEQLRFAQPTVVYDRTGTVELARFQEHRRRVVTFDQLPRIVLDSTIAVEDRTFWTNEGYDVNAILSALAENVGGGRERGASTITQQLVRATLLPPELLAPGADLYERKCKEIVQAAELTKAYPGETGKQRIITAYLNQIFYGQGAYGIAAAASVFFGVEDLARLTPAQAALLAGLPQEPAILNPYRWAQPDAEGRLVVPRTAQPVVRRDFILRSLYEGHGRWSRLSKAQLDAALAEPVILAGERPLIFKAPHFVWAMKDQLDLMLSDREPAERGGYRVITTLDMGGQALAEKYVEAAAILPNLPADQFGRELRRRGLERHRSWLNFLRGKRIENGAMAGVDYRTGDVLFYVGSKGYYREDLANRRFDPKYDVAGVGYRQPGSAFKPIVYATAFEERRLTPGSVLLDVTTSFARSWQPKNADLQERGPVSVRKALQYSLNIPAIRAMDRVGPDAVARASEKLGLTYREGPTHLPRAGLAGAIGTAEVRLLELVSAYGAFGNGGVRTAPRMILEVQGPNGEIVHEAGAPLESRAYSPQTAYLITDILAGNTDPGENLIWGPLFNLRNGPRGQYRPAAIKTGTTNDTRDLSAYGFLAPPDDPTQPAIALGVWMGNSDHSPPIHGDVQTFASDGPARVWHGFMQEYMAGKPVAAFTRPNKGLVQVTIDKWSGGRPGEWTRDTVDEWFIAGTQPGSRSAIDPSGMLYTMKCGEFHVDPVKAEKNNAPETWYEAVRDWARRARGGEGRRSAEFGTTTTHFWGESGWGGPIIPDTCPEPSPPPTREPEPTAADEPEPAERTPRPTCRPGTERPPGCRTVERPEPTDAPERTPRPTCRPGTERPPGCRPVDPPEEPPEPTEEPDQDASTGSIMATAPASAAGPAPDPAAGARTVRAWSSVSATSLGILSIAILPEARARVPTRLARRRWVPVTPL